LARQPSLEDQTKISNLTATHPVAGSMDLEFSEVVLSIAKLLLRAVSFTAVIMVKGCYTILIAPVLSILLFPFAITWALVTWPIAVLGPYYDDIVVSTFFPDIHYSKRF
jgi:hypothetical protein